jgi:hypothetical protein
MKTVLTLIGRSSGDTEVAGTLAIGAPGASYAVALSQHSKNPELLPPAAADCATGKIDQDREDEESDTKTINRPRKRGSSTSPLRA